MASKQTMIDLNEFLENADEKLSFGPIKTVGEGAMQRTIMDIRWDGGPLKTIWPECRWSGLWLEDKSKFEKKEDKKEENPDEKKEEKKDFAPSYSMTVDYCERSQVKNLPSGSLLLEEFEKKFEAVILKHLNSLDPDTIPAKIHKKLEKMPDDVVKPFLVHPSTEKSRGTPNPRPDKEKPKRAYLKTRQWKDGNFSTRFYKEVEGNMTKVDALDLLGRNGAGAIEPVVLFESLRLKDEMSYNIKPSSAIVNPQNSDNDEEELALRKKLRFNPVKKESTPRQNPNETLRQKKEQQQNNENPEEEDEKKDDEEDEKKDDDEEDEKKDEKKSTRRGGRTRAKPIE